MSRNDSRRGCRSSGSISSPARLELPNFEAAKAQESCPIITQEAVAQRAYAIWQAKGCPCGQDDQHWLEAEAQLRPVAEV